MKRADVELVDEVIQAVLDHSWREHMPNLTADQWSELLPLVQRVLSRPKPRLPSVPKEYRPKPRTNAPVDRGSQKLGRDFVYGRSGGWCEIALPDLCAGLGAEWHHRLNRSQGGRWDASNGLHACSPCHDYVTNRGRELAKRNGWAVAPGVTAPIEVPVLRRGVLVFLDDVGGFEPVDERVA